MTPEEKLLALIQQEKRQGTAAVPAVVQNQEVRSQESESRIQNPETKVPEPVSVTPVPAKPVVAPAPAAVAVPVKPVPVVAAAPVPVPPVEKKLKVAPPAAPAELVAGPRVDKLPSESPKVAPSSAIEPSAAAQVGQLNNQATDNNAVSGVVVSGGMSGMTLLNRVLAVVVLALLVLVVYSVASSRSVVGEAIARQVSGAGSLSVHPQVVLEDQVPKLELYLEKINARDILAEYVVKKPGDPVGQPEVEGAPKDLKLVAVSVDSASDGDSMAIIKSKADSKTYFVKQGQTVGGTDYVLDKVLADRVVLKLRKKQYELK